MIEGRLGEIGSVLDAHDIRYLSPAEEGRFGLPVGNGDVGAMVWTPDDRLQITVNKSNAWDDAPELPVPNWIWSPQGEEKTTALVSCAALSIRNHLPVYDVTYLDDFEARVHLREGYVSVKADSPMCSTAVKVLVTQDPAVLVVDYDETSQEEVEREVTLSRWGSRRFNHWYGQIVRDTHVGLGGTSAGCDGETVWIEQQLRRISFAVVARFVGSQVRTDCPNGHTARIVTERARQMQGQLYLAVVTSEDDEDPLSEARRRVDQAVAMGVGTLVEENSRRWEEFWSRSFVRLPDPYLENLYYFSLYQAGASSTGKYPPMHHGGIWLWNHDVNNWGSYFHWGEQQVMWPVHAAGHPELAHGYYEWRYDSLGHAQETARKVHGIGGAFFTDISDRDGRQCIDLDMKGHLNYNLTPGLQIAMDFWRHYQYTGDEAFLRERAYPVMKECAQFYLEYVEQDEDGVYHVPASVGYEGHLRVRDCVPDLCVIRQSFGACIEAASLLGVDVELRLQWQDVLEHLAGFTLIEHEGQTVIATGIALEDEEGISSEVGRSYVKGEPLFYRAFWLPMAPAFPSGVVGLAQAGNPVLEAARNGVRIVGPTAAGGWIPSAIFAARLGMREEAQEWLEWYVNHCQVLPQGFMQEGQSIALEGSTDIWAVDEPFVARDGRRTTEKAQILARRHDVPVPECNCDVMTAIQEMLFQSHDGILRVFPAAPDAWADVAFRLHAVGGFIVTAERGGGETTCVTVESTRGGLCCVANPWLGRRAAMVTAVSREREEITSAEVIAFETTPGGTYEMRPETQVQEPSLAPDMKVSAPGPRQAYWPDVGNPALLLAQGPCGTDTYSQEDRTMVEESMTPKERWLAVFRHEKPDRIPMDYWATPEATARLASFLGCDDRVVVAKSPREPSLSPWGGWASGGGWKTGGAWTLAEEAVFERLHIDAVVALQPDYVGPVFPKETDVFGCQFQDMVYGTGIYSECTAFPLAQFDSIDEIESNYTWPTADWFDYSVIPGQIEGREQYPVSGGGSEPFLVYCRLRGMQQAYMDLLINAELAHYCLDRLFELCYQNTLRILEQVPGKVTLSYIAEDFGSQEHLLMSRELIHEFLLPGMRRMIDLVHQGEAYVFFHSDGAVREILPDMVDAGIDLLNPVQWRCSGMDREGLKDEFGDSVIFHGGVDNQQTLAYGSVEDVRKEVLTNLEQLGAGGGYILAPCHNIQAVNPPENIVTMYRTALESGVG